MKRTNIDVTDYRVLFEREGFPGSGSSCLLAGNRLLLTLNRASDAERGISTFVTESTDMGRTWAEPRPFGPALADPEVEFQGVGMAHVTTEREILACGIHLAHGYEPKKGPSALYRPADILVGRSPIDKLVFTWTSVPSGTYLDEQFVAPGITLPGGRILFTMWGSATRDDNWQCGVLISDDGARTLRYRQVGYEPDKSIRLKPDLVAGYNEQTLFALTETKIVSIIRGRAHLGEVYGSSNRSSECYFLRSVSTDAGETWSHPEVTNLPGTGAPSDGLVLPDGSLILPARVPTTWSRHQDHNLCGLNIARSWDEGRTWESELVFTRAPGGEIFDNYYNIMNGTFVHLGDSEAMYVFGHSRRDTKTLHPVYAVHLGWS